MGFTLFHRIAGSLGWPVDPDPDPDGPIELAYDEFAQAVAMLEASGFPTERTAEEAWPDFRGWRVNYEQVAYRLADRVTRRRRPGRAPGAICGPGWSRRADPRSADPVAPPPCSPTSVRRW